MNFTHPTSRLVGGGVILIAAKVVFVVSGYVMYSGLARLLPAAEFGVYLVVNGSVAVLNALFITGTIQTVSRFISSRSPADAGGVVSAMVRLQAGLAALVCGAFVVGAPILASWLGDGSLVPLLRVAAIIPAAYAFYAIYIGCLNGLRRFVAQAAFDMAFSVLKVSAVLGLVALGFGVLGAVSGFAAAAVLICTAAMLYVRPTAAAAAAVTATVLFRYEAAVMAYQAVTNLTMQLDVLMLKGLMPAALANASVAQLGAAAKLAQIPQSLLVALNFLVFPLIAKAHGDANREAAGLYVRAALRVCLVLVLGAAAVLVSGNGEVMALVYGRAYATAGPLLVTLCWGYAALAILGILLTVLNGAGRPMGSLALMAATIVAQASLNLWLIPAWGAPGAALATTVGMTAGMLVAVLVVSRAFGAVLDVRTVVRTTLAAAITIVVGRAIAATGMWIVLEAAGLGVLYLLLLAVLGELRRGMLIPAGPPSKTAAALP